MAGASPETPPGSRSWGISLEILCSPFSVSQFALISWSFLDRRWGLCAHARVCVLEILQARKRLCSESLLGGLAVRRGLGYALGEGGLCRWPSH